MGYSNTTVSRKLALSHRDPVSALKMSQTKKYIRILIAFFVIAQPTMAVRQLLKSFVSRSLTILNTY